MGLLGVDFAVEKGGRSDQVDLLGVAGLNKLRLSGQDIDNRCVLMSKIQLRINGLDTFGRRMRLLGALETLACQPG